MSVESLLNDVFSGGFNFYKKSYVAFILGALVAAVGSIFIITAPPLFFGLYFMASKLLRGEEVVVKDVLRGFDFFFVSWFIFLAGGLAVLLGFMFFVVPGFVLLVLFQFAVPVAILEKLGALDSLQRSARIAWDNLAFSAILWIVLAALTSLGSSVALGWLLAYPYTVICTCLAAQKLAEAGKK